MSEEKYGAIVAATGFNPIKVDKYDEFAYSQSPDVVTLSNMSVS